MKPALFAFALLTLPTVAFAAPADPLDALIGQYEAYVQAHDPDEAATVSREPATRWADVSPAAAARQEALAASLLEEIREASTPRSIDRSILIRLLEDDLRFYASDAARIPFTGDWGFQAEPVFAALRLRISSVAEAEAWILRLQDVPRYFAQNRENMERGIRTGWTAHADPLGTVRQQLAAQLAKAPEESDLYFPFTQMAGSIPDDTRRALQARGLESVALALSAYQEMLDFIDEVYAPAAREQPGIAALEGGREVYADLIEMHTAGAGYSAEEIHAIGQAEVTRIRAAMDGVIRASGFEGSFREFQKFLRTDPQFYAGSEADLMQAARDISRRLDAILPAYFHTLPRLGYRVEPVPLSIAPGYTSGRYISGDLVENRPGTYLVNTYALDQRPLYELPALSAHEAVPGHHLQIALAQEMPDQPRFRQQYYATAFGEGWGLYAEWIASEAGLMVTPYEQFGALSMEMWRACRLVADTGLHWYGWSREQAEACFLENTALAPLNIRNELTRYIGWPGQATAYKIGELKLRALRAEAEETLAGRFDIRDFHDVVLANGSVPMDVLEDQVRRWIDSGAGPVRP